MGQGAPAGSGKARGRTSAGRQEPEALARRIARLALEKKAESVLLLDLRELSSACDFFVLASGLSELQVKALAEHIEETLAGESVRPWHVEGRHHRRWILLDYVDVVVHLFHKDARDFYRLENLWADAPRELITDEPPGEHPAGGETTSADEGPSRAAGTAAAGRKRRAVSEGRGEKRHPQEE